MSRAFGPRRAEWIVVDGPAPEPGDDAAPEDDVKDVTAASAERAVGELAPLAELSGEEPQDSPPRLAPLAERGVEADDEAGADARLSAIDSALPSETPSPAAPSDEPLDEDALFARVASQPRRTRTRRMAKPAEKAKPRPGPIGTSPTRCHTSLATWNARTFPGSGRWTRTETWSSITRRIAR